MCLCILHSFDSPNLFKWWLHNSSTLSMREVKRVEILIKHDCQTMKTYTYIINIVLCFPTKCTSCRQCPINTLQRMEHLLKYWKKSSEVHQRSKYFLHVFCDFMWISFRFVCGTRDVVEYIAACQVYVATTDHRENAVSFCGAAGNCARSKIAADSLYAACSLPAHCRSKKIVIATSSGSPCPVDCLETANPSDKHWASLANALAASASTSYHCKCCPLVSSSTDL